MYSTEPLVEAAVVHDIFASGLARIEDIGGGVYRMTLYAKQKSVIYNDERVERVIVARILMPASKIIEACHACMYAVDGIEGAVGKIAIEKAH